MNRIKYYIYWILSKFLGNKMLTKYYRSLGMTIGNGTHIFSKIVSSEPFLISIGDNVTISTGVTFLTHDASIGAVVGRNVYSDLVGPINVGDNCFIGANSIILPGVTIPSKSIVAAGSVVTKTISKPNMGDGNNDGIIIGGNPAKYICDTKDFIEKRNMNFLKLHGHPLSARKSEILKNKERWINK